MNKYYTALKVLSYNAILNMIITNRNYGKTWTFKRRAWRRAVKHGKKTLRLRIFKKEVKEAVNSFYTSIDLQKFCGIVPYDPKTKTGNFKQIGHTFYILRNNKWEWFLKVAALSDSNVLRSADDVKCDTIVFDEFTTTADKLRRYRGDIVSDFIDLFISTKRKHEVKLFLLGNKENILNPFLSYFGIKPLPNSFNGIKTYRSGSILIQQLDNKPSEESDYDKKLKAMLKDTKYGNYLYNGSYKNQTALITRKTPPNANIYIQLNINGYELKISVLNGFFYVNNRIDKKRDVYVLNELHKYPKEFLLVKRQKRYFIGLINALSDRRVYYDNEATYEAIQQFYNWLGI